MATNSTSAISKDHSNTMAKYCYSRRGKIDQVRRMTAAVGHPTLRLIRYAIGDWHLLGLQPGESKVLDG